MSLLEGMSLFEKPPEKKGANPKEPIITIDAAKRIFLNQKAIELLDDGSDDETVQVYIMYSSAYERIALTTTVQPSGKEISVSKTKAFGIAAKKFLLANGMDKAERKHFFDYLGQENEWHVFEKRKDETVDK